MNAHNPLLTQLDVSSDIAGYITRYVKIRDKKAELQKKHQEELAPYNEALYHLEQAFLRHLNSTNSDNAVAKGAGTVYRATKHRATIEDPATFRRHIIGGELWHLVDWRANAPAVFEAMEADKMPVPGIKFASEQYVNIRRA